MSFMIGDLAEAHTVMLCEGFATVASLCEATGHPVTMAFSANKMTPIAEQLRQQFATATLLVCGELAHKRTGDWKNYSRQSKRFTAPPVELN